MKKKNEDLEKKIEETMESLDHLQRVEANPYLYHKIQERLQASAQKNVRQSNWNKQLGFAFLVLLMTVNVFTILQYNRTNSTTADGMSTISQAYGWSESSSDIYDNFILE